MTKEQKARIVARAVALLQAGTLPSVLAGQLMTEFDLTPAQARELAAAALKQYKGGDQ